MIFYEDAVFLVVFAHFSHKFWVLPMVVSMVLFWGSGFENF